MVSARLSLTLMLGAAARGEDTPDFVDIADEEACEMQQTLLQVSKGLHKSRAASHLTSPACGHNAATFNPSTEYCADSEIGGVVCPIGHSVCFDYSCGGASHENAHCYNPETHQCLPYGYGCSFSVCALGERTCGAECVPERGGVCCGEMNSNPEWHWNIDDRQCCQGRCQGGGCEAWDCDALTERCVLPTDSDWSNDNPRACAPTGASVSCGHDAVPFNPFTSLCVGSEIGGIVCPIGQESVCFDHSCGGASRYHAQCYNAETHQCLPLANSYGCSFSLCALGERTCGAECVPEGAGVCCGEMNSSPEWHWDSENRQCCQGRCQGGGCEAWDCDARTERCVALTDPDWSNDNPRACAPVDLSVYSRRRWGSPPSLLQSVDAAPAPAPA